MQKKYGFPALGGTNSATKQLIFGANAARLYRINLKAADKTRIPAYSEDRLACLKNEYELAAKEPSNLRYGYGRRPGSILTSSLFRWSGAQRAADRFACAQRRRNRGRHCWAWS